MAEYQKQNGPAESRSNDIIADYAGEDEQYWRLVGLVQRASPGTIQQYWILYAPCVLEDLEYWWPSCAGLN
jgi:hypothetical protein